MNDVFVHSTAIVETTQIGDSTRIWAYTHVMNGVSIGVNCNIGEHCFIESGVAVGGHVTIKNGNMLWEGVRLEDGVFLGPRVTFTNDLYPRSPRLPQARKRYRDKGWLRPTVVGQGASVGAGAVILGGVTLGEFCMVGAGATVTRDVPPHALVVGSPARLRGWVCQCGLPLTISDTVARCAECEFVFVNTDASADVLPPAA
jgi:UDP-2-acetamido-3-amino-2,3-dideoxy-glucuronate N-acetyltransferase